MFVGRLGDTTMQIPSAVPEIPVRSLGEAIQYYVSVLGFDHDWGDPATGNIAGISQDDCRLFLTDAGFHETYGAPAGPIVFWLNLNSKQEVDGLYQRWKQAGATLLSEPEDKPWLLREFRAADLDGNQIRVFYDFSPKP